MLSMTLAVLVLLVTFLLCLRDCTKPRAFPPGPYWLPLVGCLPIFQRLRAKHGYLHLAFEKLAETHGPILGLKLGQQIVVLVSGHELTKKVLLCDEFNGRPDDFMFRLRAFGARKGACARITGRISTLQGAGRYIGSCCTSDISALALLASAARADISASGVLFTDGTTWSHNRRVTMKHLRAFGFGQPSMQKLLTIEAQDLVQSLRDKSEGGKPVAMHTAFNVAVLNVLWTMLAGYRYSYVDPKLDNIFEISREAFKVTDTLGGFVSQMPFLRHIIPELCGYNDLMSVLEKLWAFVGEEVDSHEKKMRSNLHEAEDLIDAFVLEMMNSEKHPEARKFDRQEILVLCLDLFLAGSKTTTDALVITFSFLAHHPEWLKKLHEDLDRVVGKNRDPVLEDAVLMPRVEAFIAEVQRIHTLTPLGVPHNAMKNVSFEGYEIPKDSIVLVNYHTANNDETVWERPNEFLPERFLDKNGQFNKKTSLIQFGLGKRRCLGETLARSSLFLFFTHVVHHFDIGISEEYGLPCLDGIDGFVISPKPSYLVLTQRF